MGRPTGTYREIAFEDQMLRAFVPEVLPPDPAIVLDDPTRSILDEAMVQLARLEVAGAMVQSTQWFLYGFVRKEAVLSSQIEGTQATLPDLVRFEATEKSERPEDIEEVCNYVKAIGAAREMIDAPGNARIGVSMWCSLHRILMSGVRGADRMPGRIRQTQNWIGGTNPLRARFIPPPAAEVQRLLESLEDWIHSEDPMPDLVRVALAHAQFETIHPFLDGNGRIGRMLISLLLEHWEILSSPLLYVSHVLKDRRREYYDRLTAVRDDGDWAGWIRFFLECVRDAAADGVEVIGRLHNVVGRDRRRLLEHERVTVSAVRLLDALGSHPIVTLPLVTQVLDVSKPTASSAIELLVEAGILAETTGRQRDREYAYRAYLGILTGD